MRQMESVRLKINEQLASVGEEILFVVDKQRGTADVCSVDSVTVELSVRVFVLERLSAVGEFMVNLFQREMDTLETLLETRNDTKLHTAGDASSMTVVEPQKRVRGRPRKYPVGLPSPALQSALIQPERRKGGRPRLSECDGLVPSPLPEEEEERAGRGQEREEETGGEDEERTGRQHDGDPTWHPGDFEDDDRETEPVAGTSTEHVQTQTDDEDCGTSQPTADDQLLSSHCSESDTEDIDEDWEDTREGHLALDTLQSQKRHNVEGQRLSLSKTLSQDLKSSKHSRTGKKISGKGSSQKCDVKQHTRTKKKRNPCTCEVCGKLCIHKGNLNAHMRSHTGEKPFTCTVCCKGFSQIGNLQLHMRTHSGEKPFTCTVCGKSFNHTSHLRTHMMIHSEKKSLICEICGKGFTGSGSLKSHMNIHSGEKPFSCTVCCKGFSQIGNLQAHMRTHTGEKPYNCIVCGKGFSQQGGLKKHMRVHTGEKPFTCTWCAKQFGQKENLQKHTRRKHTVVKPT